MSNYTLRKLLVHVLPEIPVYTPFGAISLLLDTLARHEPEANSYESFDACSNTECCA